MKQATANEASPNSVNTEDHQNPNHGTPSGSSDLTVNEHNNVEQIPLLRTPRRKKTFKSVVVDLDGFQKSAFRNHVVGYYRCKEVPTLRKLKKILREADLLSECIEPWQRF